MGVTGAEYGFGVHLVVDGYGCDRAVLEDIGSIYRFLENSPDDLGMTKIMPPYVFEYRGKVPEDWGLSGFVLIAESHISVHTFPDKYYMSLDMFSCKPFNTDEAAAMVKRYFRVQKCEIQVLDRGREFPRSIPETSKIVEMDRVATAGSRR